MTVRRPIQAAALAVLAAALVLFALAATAVISGSGPARAGGDPTSTYVRVTPTTATGGGSESTSLVALDYELEATALGCRHQYGLFTLRRVMGSDAKMNGDFVGNRQFSQVQIDVLSPEGATLAGYRLTDASFAAVKHTMTYGSFAVEEAGLAFASIEYHGFGPAPFSDVNTQR